MDNFKISKKTFLNQHLQCAQGCEFENGANQGLSKVNKFVQKRCPIGLCVACECFCNLSH
jgi:hypothetical protein